MSYIKPTDIDLNNLILPTALKASGMPGFKYSHRTNQLEYITHSIDRFYIPSREDCKNLKCPFPQPTDLALVLSMTNVDKNGCISMILRDKGNDVYIQSMTSECFFNDRVVNSETMGFSIMMNLDIEEAKKLMYTNPNSINMEATENYITGDKYSYLLFGKFPQSYVGDKLNNELLKKYANNLLDKSIFDNKGNPIIYNIPHHKTVYCKDSNEEYLLVSDITFRKNLKLKSSKDSTIKLNQHMFFKIEPIKWQILNPDELPISIGSNASYSQNSNKVKLITNNMLLAGIYVNMQSWYCGHNDIQNPIKKYLSNDFEVTAFGKHLPPISYEQVEKALTDIGANIKYCNLAVPITSSDVVKEIETQQKESDTPTDTTKKSYLDENGQLTPEFIEELHKIEQARLGKQKITQGETEKEMEEKNTLQVEEINMDIQEQIKFYVNNGISFMLHGLSGIGKSSRVRSINPEHFVGLSLSDGMLPEEVKGKTLYPVGAPSYWEPPHWYTKITNLCEKHPNETIVFFIDELTNVDPHVQDLVFDLIQYKSIAPNQGQLPKNCVVVAAGNDKQDSSAAYSLAEPLFRKFSAHIYIPLSVEEFIKYGSKPSKDYPNRPQIHPLITSFVASYGKKVLHSYYDKENPPKYAIDPRGWEQLSNVIYACDNKIIKSLIENKLGPNLTASFIAFAKTPLITPKDILNGNVKNIPSDIDRQLAIALSLRMVDKKQLPYVLSFISKNMHKEVLQTFMVEWADKDPDKLLFINNILEQGVNTSSTPVETPTPQTGKIKGVSKMGNHTDALSEEEVFGELRTQQDTSDEETTSRPTIDIRKIVENTYEQKATTPSTSTESTEEITPEQSDDSDSGIIPKKTNSAFSRWWDMKNEDFTSSK